VALAQGTLVCIIELKNYYFRTFIFINLAMKFLSGGYTIYQLSSHLLLPHNLGHFIFLTIILWHNITSIVTYSHCYVISTQIYCKHFVQTHMCRWDLFFKYSMVNFFHHTTKLEWVINTTYWNTFKDGVKYQLEIFHSKALRTCTCSSKWYRLSYPESCKFWACPVGRFLLRN